MNTTEGTVRPAEEVGGWIAWDNATGARYWFDKEQNAYAFLARASSPTLERARFWLSFRDIVSFLFGLAVGASGFIIGSL